MSLGLTPPRQDISEMDLLYIFSIDPPLLAYFSPYQTRIIPSIE